MNYAGVEENAGRGGPKVPHESGSVSSRLTPPLHWTRRPGRGQQLQHRSLDDGMSPHGQDL